MNWKSRSVATLALQRAVLGPDAAHRAEEVEEDGNGGRSGSR